MSLIDGFLRAAARWPERVAVEEPEGDPVSYTDLDRLSDRVRDHLVAKGVRTGDRVGIRLHKSIDSVASILGILKAGAAYVPVDPLAPASRNAYIFADCGVKAILVEEAAHGSLVTELAQYGASPAWIVLPEVGGGRGLAAALGEPSPPASTLTSSPDTLAYILYTSGSTGKPKGVMISHCNARRFVDWCTRTFSPGEEDRFSSHAPFHFDLSILDIYTPLENGAALCLIPEDVGKDPQRLTELISSKALTVWYSTPSILSLLVDYGDHEVLRRSAPRLTLFAGEVFPVGKLNALREMWPESRYYNLYGPTETNVCTYLALPADIEPHRREPYPVGVLCEHYRGMVVDGDGAEVDAGAEGELLISGDGVMVGYWNLEDQSRDAFLEIESVRWYRTGDLVVEKDGVMTYVGRRDRMVKKRGYRVELGEIEACLHRHPNVREAAVVAVSGHDTGVQIHAHLSTRDGAKISVIKLKAFCSESLPQYMIPDRVRFHAALPKTSTDKTDYQSLLKIS